MESQPNPTVPSHIDEIADRVPPVSENTTDGVNVRGSVYESPEQRVDQIEMIGEEAAAGYIARNEVSAGMRYLHCSRTIHQLVTDRNRAVGLYLAVATILWTASTALLNAQPSDEYIIALQHIQKWCLPATFGVLTVLAALVAFLLIRTRIGLIYEVAKMNVLLGLPLGRVKRINPLSIFFIMQLIISLAGGGSAALFTAYMVVLAGMESGVPILSVLVGVVVAAGLVGLYIVTVLNITTEAKLQDANEGTRG